MTYYLLNPCHATPNFKPIRLLDSGCWYNFTCLVANSIDPDQLASSEANISGSTLFAKEGVSGFSRTKIKKSMDIVENINEWKAHNRLSRCPVAPLLLAFVKRTLFLCCIRIYIDYHIYSKYWDNWTPYHTCPNILHDKFFLLRSKMAKKTRSPDNSKNLFLTSPHTRLSFIVSVIRNTWKCHNPLTRLWYSIYREGGIQIP